MGIIWIGFDGKVAEELEKLTEPVFQINGAVFEKIKNCKNYYNMRESYLVSCIHLILCQIFESAAEIDVVSSIKNYIDANYMYNIKISDIAKDVNLDRKYLARIYKLKTGYTMKKHIIKNEWKRQRIFWVMDIMLTKLLS